MVILVNNKYIIQNKINEGAFGKIFTGIHKDTQEEIIIKIENKDNTEILLHEARIYNCLKNMKGIPKMRCFGTEGKYTYLVMDKLYKSLEDLHQSNLFTQELIIKTAIEMIRRIELLHKNNIIHRDIKPENFMIHKKDKHIFVIDFGLSKAYRYNGKHISYKTEKSMVGTARYASINTHKGIEYSRRDDLESMGYIFIYFFKKKLPWQGIKISSSKKKFEKICNIKENICLDDLCKNIPTEFKTYIKYCRNLEFSEKPNYDFLIHNFEKLLNNETKNNWFMNII